MLDYMPDAAWQDIVLGVGQLLFLVALIPSLRSEDKPALGTSVMTGALLTVFAVVYLTLGLLFSTISSLIIALGWWTLAFQKLRKR